MLGASWGGSEELWSKTALQLVRAGWPVVASVSDWQGPVAQHLTLERLGVRVVKRTPPQLTVRLLRRIRPRREFEWLGELKPRFVLISQGWNWSFVAIEAAEESARLGIPYAILSHGGPPWDWPDDDGADRMLAVHRRAAASYFVSMAVLERTRMQLGDRLCHAAIVRNPFGVDYDSPMLWPDADELRLAMVARIDPGIKGHDLLFAALAGEQWKDRNLRVTLYGSGPYQRIVSRLGQHFGTENISLGGYVEPVKIWRQNHALVLPSRTEAIGIVVVEAMLAGRPCICTPVGGVVELVEDGVTGFLARDVTAAGVADALERAWDRRADWKSMGEAAAVRIRQLVPRDPAAVFASQLEKLIPKN